MQPGVVIPQRQAAKSCSRVVLVQLYPCRQTRVHDTGMNVNEGAGLFWSSESPKKVLKKAALRWSSNSNSLQTQLHDTSRNVNHKLQVFFGHLDDLSTTT